MRRPRATARLPTSSTRSTRRSPRRTEFAATLPTDAEEIDSDAVAEHQAAIQDAASRVTEACAE